MERWKGEKRKEVWRKERRKEVRRKERRNLRWGGKGRWKVRQKANEEG